MEIKLLLFRLAEGTPINTELRVVLTIELVNVDWEETPNVVVVLPITELTDNCP